MAEQWPPLKNTATTFPVFLPDMSALPNLRSNPTLAAGDVTVFIDYVSNGNITTLPVVTPAGSRMVKVDLTANEMNGDNIVVQFVDQSSPKQWSDVVIVIQPVSVQLKDVAIPGDAMTLTAGERINMSDALLKHDLSTVVGEAPRSVLNAIRKLMNRVRIGSGVLSVYKEDDLTVAFTQTLAQDINQSPIQEVDTN